MIPIQYALRRRMTTVEDVGSAPISDLPLGTLINIGTDGGDGTPNYEIADINNLVPGGVVLVRKNIYSKSEFGSTTSYPNDTLDYLMYSTINGRMPKKLRDKMMNVTFSLAMSSGGSKNIGRKTFALTYTMAGFGNNGGGVAEGKALQLYKSDASRVKTFKGSTNNWWLSSQYDSDRVRIILYTGSDHATAPSDTRGVVPAFAIPGDTLSKLKPNTDGSYNLIL